MLNPYNKDISCPYPLIAPDISTIQENVTLKVPENCLFLLPLFCLSDVLSYALSNGFISISLGTEFVAKVMDPDLMTAEIIFALFWFIMFIGFFWDVYFLSRDKEFTRIKQYRWNVAIIGSILSALQIFYWVFHETRGYFSHKVNFYINELTPFLLFIMSIGMFFNYFLLFSSLHCSRLINSFVHEKREKHKNCWHIDKMLYIEMVDFWAILAKVAVKLTVSKSGISRKEKVFLILLIGIGMVIFSACSIFGPYQTGNLFNALKYLFAGVAALLLALRSLIVVYLLDKEIIAMRSSAREESKKNVQVLLWQLRFKYGVFFVVLLAFTIFTLDYVPRYFEAVKYGSDYLISNRSSRFNISADIILYCFGATAILLQFSNISSLCRLRESSSHKAGGSEKNSVSPTDTARSSHMHASMKHDTGNAVAVVAATSPIASNIVDQRETANSFNVQS